MAFDSAGSVSFAVNGEQRVFNFILSVTGDERLRVAIEDSVTNEKWETADLAIHDFANEHTTITQAGTGVYAKLIAQCLNERSNDSSTLTSLSQPSESDQSRFLSVSCQLQVFTQTVTLKYSFHLFPQPEDHVEKLTRENERLQACVAQLTRENERLTLAARKATEELAAEREQHGVQVATMTRELKQLKTSDHEETERATMELEDHEAIVSTPCLELDQQNAPASTSPSNTEPEPDPPTASVDCPPPYTAIDISTVKGVVKTIVKEGSGPTPTRGAWVLVHATGYGKNNDLSEKFWSSMDTPSQAFSFQVGAGRVIKGWDEGVLGMRVGERAELLIAPDYAYGARGAPHDGIGRNTVVRFDIELLEIY